MKNPVIVLCFTLFSLNTLVQAQKGITFVEKQEVPVGVIAPKELSHIDGRPRQKKPTNVVFQKNGEDIGVYGKLEMVSLGEKNSIYQSTGIMFLIPNSHYKMEPAGKFLQTSSGGNVEALIVDLSTEYDCAEIKFNKDSISTNILEPQKLVMNLPKENVDWSHTSYSVSPIIESAVVDEIDPDENAFYSLAVKIDDKKVCRRFQLNRDLKEVEGVKKMVYEIMSSENTNFSETDDVYMLGDKPITGYMILKDIKPTKKSRAKKIKHNKKTKR